STHCRIKNVRPARRRCSASSTAAARTEGEGMPGVRSRSAGALEALVMQALSSTGTPMSARTIQATFKDPAAQATVLTVLSRLEGKGLVTRHASSPRRVTFEATMSSAQPHASNMVELLDGAEDREGALLAFADSLSEEDLDLVMDAITSRRERLTPGNGIPDSVAVALSQRRR